MPKITTERYKEFLNNGIIDPIYPEQFKELINNINYKQDPEQARALLIAIYYSGRRESEIAELKPEDIEKQTKIKQGKLKRYIVIRFKTLKGGKESRLYFPATQYMQEFYKFAKINPPGTYIFRRFRVTLKNKVCWKTNKKIFIREFDGTISQENLTESKEKTYLRQGTKIFKYIKKWTGLPPHFFRHNRLSILSESGATDRELLQFKGASDYKSIQLYVHLSRKTALKMADDYFEEDQKPSLNE